MGMLRIMKSQLLITILSVFCFISVAYAETYTVRIVGLKNDSGVVRISLYNSASTYKSQSKAQSFRVGVVPVHNHQAIWKISNIPAGDYALLFYHDDDNSNQFKKNFLGIPTVGYGYSGNSRSKTSLPSFDNAKFTFDASHKSVTAHMLYW